MRKTNAVTAAMLLREWLSSRAKLLKCEDILRDYPCIMPFKGDLTVSCYAIIITV
jgi:hypothetical protein